MRPMIRRNENWLPDVFNAFFDNDIFPKTKTTSPAINVKESDTQYTVELAAPGLKKEDFELQINEEGDLHLKLESKQESKDEDKKEQYLRHEFAYERYEQTFVLPEDVDKEKISAKMEHGVLTINLPKLAPKEMPKIGRKVEID